MNSPYSSGADGGAPCKPGPPEKRWSVTTMLLGIIAAVLAGAALRQAQTVLVPLILAWMIAQLLSPMVKFFARGRVPTGLATILALLVLLVIFYWIAIFVSLSAASFINKVPAYSENAATTVSNAIREISERYEFLSNEAVARQIRNEVTGFLKFLMGMAGSLAGALTSWLAKLIMIFVMATFMLIAQPYTERKISNAFPADIAGRLTKILGSISRQISHYLAVQFFLSAATGLLVWLSCRIVGVEAAITWGALAFFLNFIPTVGSIVAGIPPVILAILQFPTIWPAVWLAIAILAINQVIGNAISPKVMGDQMNLSPATVLLSLLFWGWLWGIAGAFLSVIITCSVKIICENIDALRPFSVMMESGKRMPSISTATSGES